MISANLPALQVVVPLLAAPLCVLLRNGRAAWLLASLVTWATFLVALALLARVADEGTISYALGDWAPPWGIEYRVDLIGALVLVIVSGIGALVMPFALSNVEREIPADRIYLFYVMYLLCLTGLLGIAITGDAFNLFVFLEISSLSSYVLISLGKDRRALTAALRYLIMGTLGATFYVIGVGLLYMMTGTLNMADLAQRVPELLHLRTTEAALAFLVVGISLKLALFPLHLWLPNAYAFAPTTVTIFLAATATKVSVYVIIRVLYTVYGGVPIYQGEIFDDALMGLGMLSMVAAGLVAIYQNNVKRMLAYSSVSQIGYMVLGLGFGSVLGLAAGIVHLFNHAIMKATLFMAVGCATQRVRAVSFDDLAGLGRQMPVTMGALVVGALSLIGLPLTVGFVTKWYLILAALQDRAWLAMVVILASGLFAVIYTWRIVEAAYFRPPPEGREEVREAPLAMLVPLVILAGACVVFGIGATWPMDLALAAAQALIGGQT
ncbi:MAG: monovalent cation/H+ antiporter subunit D family protein [Kiloniellales bacterium]|nr:monovalent cation/H+ antiporter subunit D family protein [Kiloniellales bacterium]